MHSDSQTNKKFWQCCIAILAVLSLFLTNCSSNKDATTQEKNQVNIGLTSITSSLDPLKKSWAITSIGVGEYVYMLDDKGNLNSRFIAKIVQDDANNWTLTTKNEAKFSDGSIVDAKALSAGLNDIQQHNKLSNATAGKITFTESDNKTIKVKTQRPTKMLKSVLAEWSNVVFKKASDGKYIFTGPYLPGKFIPSTSIELKPNPNYPDAKRRPEVMLKAFKDMSSMMAASQSGEIDMAFPVTADVAKQLESSGVKIKAVDAGYQYFALANLKSKIMGEKTIRQALNIGLNRKDYISALRGGNTATGLFAHYYSFAGKDKLTFNPVEAKKILDTAGWKIQADGIRAKNGQKLTLNLVTYPSRADLPVIMQLMVSQMKDLGIEAKTSVVDNIDADLKKGAFDLAIYAQHTAPTSEPTFYLNQFFRTKGPKNFSGYSSPAFDSLLNQMGNLPAGSEMDQKAEAAQHLLFEDLPVLFLVDPKWEYAVSNKLANYQLWCGDYFIINNQLFTK